QSRVALAADLVDDAYAVVGPNGFFDCLRVVATGALSAEQAGDQIDQSSASRFHSNTLKSDGGSRISSHMNRMATWPMMAMCHKDLAENTVACGHWQNLNDRRHETMTHN